jgi:hypothetical protein
MNARGVGSDDGHDDDVAAAFSLPEDVIAMTIVTQSIGASRPLRTGPHLTDIRLKYSAATVVSSATFARQHK